jgi:IS605 OrfB family transposase
MIRTFETRISPDEDRYGPVLDQFGRLMCVAERKIYAFLAADREWKAENYRHIYQSLGLSAVMFRSAKTSLDGKLSSISELAKVHAIDLAVAIGEKQGQIDAKDDKLLNAPKNRTKHQTKLDTLVHKIERTKVRIDVAKKAAARAKLVHQLKALFDNRDKLIKTIAAFEAEIAAIPFGRFQNTRKLAILELALQRANDRVKNPRICFGTKKLARSQNYLGENGFRDHAEWKKAWDDARNRNFQFVGVANMEGGNEVARLKLREDGLFDLGLRLPPAMRDEHGESVSFQKLSFNHGHAAIVTALATQKPLTVRFVRDETSWKVHVSIDQPTKATRFNDDLGCLGVDFNADHVAATLIDRFGNPIRSWTIPMVTYGLSTDQATDLTRKVAKQIMEIAAHYNVPISAEDLDFARKKAQLSADSGPRYARMLSSLAYSSFQRALASACARNSIHLKLVNPAFTSLIGRTMFAHRYGLSVHAAAALSIARRAMKFSEKLPKPVEGKLTLPLDDGDCVTLPRPVRIEGRHVWSSWRKLNTGYKAALAAHRLARRKSRSMELTPDGPNAGMASKGRIIDPLPVGFIQGVPG